MSNTRLFL